ncbi:lysozyme inhibitor LprI family protein [Palleronia sp. THAF1]|uniref:lysozyme inhibitor LprI family protein n=1 Tax=Palleronia sp. THAF1 TaxID=2587842 RepID=UPI001562B0C4|nr:lysozyme inhibitor LprI family protein [Palleronia sp. THAF1]
MTDATADQLMQCVGDAASACMEAEPDGQTTFGMTACMMIEAGFWDDRLNAMWPDVQAAVRADDAAEAGIAEGAFAQRAEALLTAQRAWIAFRDAECALDYALWGAGSMRSIAAASCKLDMTAARVQRLQTLLEPM